jgi:transposase
MEANMKRHEPYTQEYKLEAIQLAQTQGTAKTAANLGLNVNMLGRWKREHETRTVQGKPVFTGRGVPALSDQEKEIKQLRKELEVARQERDILKKAVAFFAKDSH